MSYVTYVKMKLRSKIGESNSISIGGWCVIATLVVAGIIAIYPDLVSGLIEKIFDNFDEKLGL